MTVYKPGVSQSGSQQQVARVSGVQVASVENLNLRARKLVGALQRCWIFYEDNGEERDEFGEGVHKFTSLEAKEKREAQGQIYRNIQGIFKQNFLKKLLIFNGSHVAHVKRMVRYMFGFLAFLKSSTI